MQKNWAEVVRRRNTREVIAAALIGGWVLWRDGIGLRTLPILGAVAFVSLVLLTVGRWRTRDLSEAAHKRELVRQGRLLQLAWFWYVTPIFLGSIVWTLSLTFTVGFALFGFVIAVANFIVGTKLVREGRR